MHHVERLGGDFSDEEKEAYVHVWRYTSFLLGIPDELQFASKASALRAFEVPAVCEPPADDDAIIMANSIINSAPILLGRTEAKVRSKMAALLCQVSRELIGQEMADQLGFPPRRRQFGLDPIFVLRWGNLADRLLSGSVPIWPKFGWMRKFGQLLDATNLYEYEPSYALPTSLYDEDSREW